MRSSLLVLLILPLLLPASPAAADPDKCGVCGRLIEAFEEGLRRTAKDNFGGGNTQWEESRLGSYAQSETRLVDIQERLCDGEGKEESVACHALLEQFEEAIEAWWFGEFRSQGWASAALRDLLCVQRSRLCCQLGAHGPLCAACAACTARGSCDGNGTRAGSGLCQCQPGYGGDLCDGCAAGHYREAPADGSGDLACRACHSACGPGGCFGGDSAANCRRDCAPGYAPAEGVADADADARPTVTCVDVDECASSASPSPCSGPHEQCANSPGSFACECLPGHRRGAGGECAPESAENAGGGSAEPGGNSAEPSGNSAEPGGNSAEPSGNSAEPSGNSAEPGGNSAEPSGNSAEPDGNFTEKDEL